jgi:hypothetical protein
LAWTGRNRGRTEQPFAIVNFDRLGRSVLHVSSAMGELDAAVVAFYSDREAIDSTSQPEAALNANEFNDGRDRLSVTKHGACDAPHTLRAAW